MPKLKTRKALKLRVRITKNGKAIRTTPRRRHLMSGKSAKKRRQLKRKRVMVGKFVKVYRRGLVC